LRIGRGAREVQLSVLRMLLLLDTRFFLLVHLDLDLERHLLTKTRFTGFFFKPAEGSGVLKVAVWDSSYLISSEKEAILREEQENKTSVSQAMPKERQPSLSREQINGIAQPGERAVQ